MPIDPAAALNRAGRSLRWRGSQATARGNAPGRQLCGGERHDRRSSATGELALYQSEQ